MADPGKRRAENVDGPFYVDTTCIDCDTCRWMAPETYGRLGEMSAVTRQPGDEAARVRALEALVSCPTASIGTAPRVPLGDVPASFPLPVTDDVLHCGYHHPSSFGAASYLLRRPGGNVLVDSPRFAAPLVRRLEELGGVSTLFLTHKDDVGDHERFAEHFGCERVLHVADADGPLRRVERLLEGEDPVALGEGLLVVPVPGHTRGSCCLLVDDTYLFSGDHVAWSVRLGHVYAFRTACWYDWDVQIASMERLAGHAYRWILPGHGRRWHGTREETAAEMARCIAWMKTM